MVPPQLLVSFLDGRVPDDSHLAATADGEAPDYWKTVLGEG